MEGYNIFNPYIDTKFAENYSPNKFDLITNDFTKDEVLKLIGKPLNTYEDDFDKQTEFIYTGDGFLSDKSNRKYFINDFAWYRSSIYFDGKGKIIRIDKGWSYDWRMPVANKVYNLCFA